MHEQTQWKEILLYECTIAKERSNEANKRERKKEKTKEGKKNEWKNKQVMSLIGSPTSLMEKEK